MSVASLFCWLVEEILTNHNLKLITYENFHDP